MVENTERIAQRVRQAIDELAAEGIAAKMGVDTDLGIVKVYTEKSYPLSKALSGLSEVLELAYTTAEHHPYWSMLYHSTEISKILLENWDSELSADNLSEIGWRCNEIRMAQERVGEIHSD